MQVNPNSTGPPARWNLSALCSQTNPELFVPEPVCRFILVSWSKRGM